MKQLLNNFIQKSGQFFNIILTKLSPQIKHHFDLVHEGKEDLIIVLWVWGGGAYLVSFFIDKFILITKIMFIKWILAILIMIYFIWHIFVIRRCSPKKAPLTAEEKELLKKDRVNRFFRKLFLREPLTKWNPAFIATVIDIYAIVYFMEYLIK
jgi:hypothetical protein